MTNLPTKLLKKYSGSIADNLCKVLSLVDLTKMSLIFRKFFLANIFIRPALTKNWRQQTN